MWIHVLVRDADDSSGVPVEAWVPQIPSPSDQDFVFRLHDDGILEECFNLRHLLVVQVCLKTVFNYSIWVANLHRQRKWPEDELLRFTNYCYYAFGLIGAYLLVLLVEFVAWRSYALYTLLIFLGVTTFVEVVMLVLTSVNVFQTARSLRSADHKFFKTEKERWENRNQEACQLKASTIPGFNHILFASWSCLSRGTPNCFSIGT